HVHQDKGHVGGNRSQELISSRKGIVVTREKDAALQVQNGELHALFGFPDKQAAAGIRGRKIRGPQKARLVRHVLENFPAVPAMISARDDLDAKAEKFFGDFWGDAEAGSG